MMRSGKTEDAVGVAGMTGITGWQVRCAFGAVETELESRRARIGARGWCKSAEGNQQTLHGNSVGDDDGDQ